MGNDARLRVVARDLASELILGSVSMQVFVQMGKGEIVVSKTTKSSRIVIQV